MRLRRLQRSDVFDCRIYYNTLFGCKFNFLSIPVCIFPYMCARSNRLKGFAIKLFDFCTNIAAKPYCSGGVGSLHFFSVPVETVRCTRAFVKCSRYIFTRALVLPSPNAHRCGGISDP